MFKFTFKSFKLFMIALVFMFTTVFASLGSAVSAATMTWDFTPYNAAQMTSAMGAGWNLGNALDANINGVPSETAWGNPVITKALIQKVKAAGFKSIRIPVTYMKKIGSAPNYAIDAAYLARVKEVVDYAYSEGLFVILNIHHDGAHSTTPNTPSDNWLLPNASDQNTIRDKFKKVWQQIAQTFVDYNEHLIFESMNEVFDGVTYGGVQPDLTIYSNINTLNQIFVDTVRLTGGNNAARWLLIPGWNTNIDYTAGNNGYTGFALPTDYNRSSTVPSSEKRIMISVHYYDPYTFCLVENGGATQWGATADPAKKDSGGQEAHLESQFKSMYDKFVKQGYAVVVGEYGAIDKSAYDSSNNTYRAIWTKAVVSTAKKYSLVPVWWDNGSNFSLINRHNLTITQQGIIDAIMSGIGNYYRIVNRHSGKALDVNGYSTADGAAVNQYAYTGGYNQQWELLHVGLNNYQLINRNSGKVLEIGGWSSSDGAAAQQWAHSGLGGYNQQWQMIDVGGGYFEFKNVASGKYLEVFGWSTNDSATVGQWSLGNPYNFNQQWQLVPIH
ncbi:cellulase family glycosylhydrolase [Paenibacillus methanolicus]|uniref:Endoglucanase n=1 Tax=Paenibacillus methanolicus TaxID=582686 RepID=A0A5S5CDR6_9BACL|nr:cellulase family glycosylhydrolase [Paenibacillus methanolicus]TYP77487.1 endoglucanase [Paenibacillus methanolicus]